MKMKPYKNVDEYIKNYPSNVQKILKLIRKEIKAAFPKTLKPSPEERIAYGIPTYTWHGNLIHFGGYEKHISLYPGPKVVAAFPKETAKYKSAKGTIQFSLEEPIPYTLIKKITKECVKQRLLKLQDKA